MEDKKSAKLAYYEGLIETISLLGSYKSTIVMDGTLLSIEFLDDLGGRYNLTVDSLADAEFEEYSRFQVNLWYNSDFLYSSVFTNVSFVKEVVEMLLKRYAD